MEQDIKDQSERRKMTREEQERYNKRTARNTGLVVRFMRICGNNKDIIWLSVLTVSILIAGYFLAKMMINITGKEIVSGLYDLAKFLVASLIAFGAFLFKLFAKQGTLSERMSSSEIVENVRKNGDIFLAVAAGIMMLAAGYFFARFYLNLSISEIKTTVVEFFEFLFVFVTAVGAFIAKLCAKQGDFSAKMSKRVENKNVSGDGRSII